MSTRMVTISGQVRRLCMRSSSCACHHACVKQSSAAWLVLLWHYLSSICILYTADESTIAVPDCHESDSVLDAAGTWITAAAHVITAVIGSGVLSLAWALSTMGWIAGPLILFSFAFVTWYTSLLLADAYRYPKDVGRRNYTYPGAVEAILGNSFCFLQCASCHVTLKTC